MYLNVKELSKYINIKSSTLYAWSAQGKIPHLKIHGLLRFHKEEIDRWAQSFRKQTPEKSISIPKNSPKTSIDILIDRAKREVFNSHRGKTAPKPSPRNGETGGAD
jgi:excisionase family DNA binding protein